MFLDNIIRYQPNRKRAFPQDVLVKGGFSYDTQMLVTNVCTGYEMFIVVKRNGDVISVSGAHRKIGTKVEAGHVVGKAPLEGDMTVYSIHDQEDINRCKVEIDRIANRLARVSSRINDQDAVSKIRMQEQSLYRIRTNLLFIQMHLNQYYRKG